MLIGDASASDRLVVISTASRGTGGKLSLLSINRGVRTVTSRDVTDTIYTLGHIELPMPFQPTNSRFLKETSTQLAKFRINDRVLARSGKKDSRTNSDHPFLRDPDSKFKLNAAESADRIAKELHQLEKRVSNSAQSVSKKFDDLTNLLTFTFTQATGDLTVTTYAPIPEPSTYAALLGLGAIGFALHRRRRQSKTTRAA